MSNKFMEPEEIQIRKDLHLERTLKELGWIEIPQTEYKRLKRDDPKNCKGYTLRWRFRYFKLKPRDKTDEDILKEIKLKVLRCAEEYFEELCKEFK